MSLPDYNFISAPLWLITILHVLTLTLHFVAMNFVLGGLVIVLWGKFTDRWQHPIVRRMIGLFPTALAATITLGVAPLLFLQLVYPRQVYAASIVSAWLWLMIVVAVIVSYYFLYGAAFSRSGGSRYRWCLSLAMPGLLYVSYVYSSVFSLAEQPTLFTELYAASQSGLVINTSVGEYVVRWLHMLLGAVTVGGFLVGLVSRDNEGAFGVAKRFYLWGMVAAALFGSIYLITLGDNLLEFMRSAAIWILTLAIILSVGSVHFFFKRKFTLAGVMLFISMLGMVTSRHFVRLLRLADHFDPASWIVKPQWSIFTVFVVCLAIAVVLIWYMIRAFSSNRPEPARTK